MSEFIIILQVILMAVGSFAVFALLLSHLRYRKMQLAALDHASDALSPSAAVMLILQALREKSNDQGMALLRIESPESENPIKLRDLIRTLLREEDQVMVLQNGVVVALVKSRLESIPSIGHRLIPLLSENGYLSGKIMMGVLEVDTDAILAWLQKGTSPILQAGWEIHPDKWEYKPEKLEAPASIDPLTGVLRADRVPRALRRMLAVHRRASVSSSLVRLDIDQLESYNVAHGREVGDGILKSVAQLLMENCRETDFIGRLQEDEFIIVMPGDPDEILVAVQRMSEVVKTFVFEKGSLQIRLSLGCGIASMPQDGRNPLLLIERAGWAMADAKKRGRGICMAYQPELKPISTAGSPENEATDSF